MGVDPYVWPIDWDGPPKLGRPTVARPCCGWDPCLCWWIVAEARIIRRSMAAWVIAYVSAA